MLSAARYTYTLPPVRRFCVSVAESLRCPRSCLPRSLPAIRPPSRIPLPLSPCSFRNCRCSFPARGYTGYGILSRRAYGSLYAVLMIGDNQRSCQLVRFPVLDPDGSEDASEDVGFHCFSPCVCSTCGRMLTPGCVLFLFCAAKISSTS